MDALLTKKADELARELAGSAATLDDLNGMMRSLMKTAIETMLNSEMSVHLGRGRLASAAEAELGERALIETTSEGADASSGVSSSKRRNRRNGSSPKTIQGESGQLPIAIPRDREGTFEPQLLGKYQRRLPGFDEKILALYAKGMTTRDIQDLVKELYGVEISPTLVSEITEDLDSEVKAWQTRRLEAIWPIVFMDGIVVHIRGESGRVSEHTMYVALGVDWEGRKELLGLWLNETEGAKFWLSCLTDLKNRGVSDIFIVCVDGLSGFPEAIQTAFPQARVQLCIVHLVRAALRYTTDKDSRAVARDLRKIYTSATVLEAEQELQKFAATWDSKYPTISKQWTAKWPHIISMFDLPVSYYIRRSARRPTQQTRSSQ